ncbi:hypothetical protein A8926_1706 [Saccharopolyspora spinosa]|uniref:Uncharacterized protein n=1 Tax=Saccharopolyspora spinosa TaxID=60894 RepID=A0A2N3XTU9_SACSN|nr:hypothetical protein A8926_1706 [Saccharopolyspora spinosa]
MFWFRPVFCSGGASFGFDIGYEVPDRIGAFAASGVLAC